MTLFELLVVVVLVGILASAAIPSYRSQMLRTRRVEAQSALLALATAQEKYHLQNGTYAGNSALTPAPPAGLGIPATTPGGRYALAIAPGADATMFAATAVATGDQAADHECAMLGIDALGVKTATRRGGSVATVCWN